MNAPELKPCPFCGGLPEGPIDATRVLGVWRLVHRGCCTLPNFSVEKSTPESAIAAWNTRADLYEAQAAEIADLRRQLAEREAQVERLLAMQTEREVDHEQQLAEAREKALDAALGGMICPAVSPFSESSPFALAFDQGQRAAVECFRAAIRALKGAAK